MQTINLHSHVGKDGILHLNVPVNMQETDVEITLIVKPVQPTNNSLEVEDLSHLSWHEFIEKTAGSLANDDSFYRHTQGEYEIREPLE